MIRQELFNTRLAITLIRSKIGQSADQRRIVEILGFRKLHQTRIHSDGPRVWGLIQKVIHLVKVTRVPATQEQREEAAARAGVSSESLPRMK